MKLEKSTMRESSQYHPFAVLFYFLVVAVIGLLITKEIFNLDRRAVGIFAGTIVVCWGFLAFWLARKQKLKNEAS